MPAAGLKRLELRARRLLTRAANATLPPAAGRPDWVARPWRVLFLRHDRIGDMIVSTAAIRAIAGAHPNLRLDVLASPENAPVLAGLPHVAHTLVFDRSDAAGYARAAGRLRRGGYDCVVDCMVTAPSTTTTLLMAATRAPWRVGVAGRGNDPAYTLPVPPSASAHMADRIGALARAFGVTIPEGAAWPSLVLSPEEAAFARAAWSAPGAAGGDGPVAGRRRVLLNLSAGSPDRMWPPEQWVAVLRAARAADPGLDVLVTGAPRDRGAGLAVAAALGGRASFTTLRHMFAIVAAADLVLTPDTSVVHAASAFRRPSLVVGPASSFAKGWGPYGGTGRYVAAAAVRDVPAAAVAAELAELLRAPASRPLGD